MGGPLPAHSYGFWRGLVDEVVKSYLACGLWQGGFATVRCRRCPEEFPVGFSCKRGGLCPSCGVKVAAPHEAVGRWASASPCSNSAWQLVCFVFLQPVLDAAYTWGFVRGLWYALRGRWR